MLRTNIAPQPRPAPFGHPCRSPESPTSAGVLRTAADASKPRGSASCADPRGVLLLYLKAPLCKELFVRRRKRSLQLHVMLLLRTASIRAMRRLIAVRLAACCCWHRERQWRVEEANLEIFILQGSSHCLCKELVQCHRVWFMMMINVRRQIRSLSGEPLCSLQCIKNQGES